MKKSYFFRFIFCLFLLGTLVINAQVNVSAKAGFNISNFTGDDTEDLETKSGVIAGIGLQYKLTNSISLEPELLFTMKGATNSEVGRTNELSLNYFEVPVIISYSFPLKPLEPSLFVGPAIGFNISANMEQTVNGNQETIDISDNVKTIDYGLSLGGGIDFSLGNNKIGIEGRYTMGLSSFDDSPEEADLKNSTISILALITF